jgi:hypothetical protein
MTAPFLMALIPQADPLALPAPIWLLWFLLTLTFLLHVLPMNFILGGAVLAAVSRLRGVRGDAHALALSRWIGKALPTMVAAAVTFGVAPLLFVQVLYGRLFFPSAIVMGWFWFAVVPILILAYYGAYLLAFRGGRLGNWEGTVGWLVAVFFAAIAFLYSNAMSLMLRPEAAHAKHLADGRGLSLNLDDPTFYFRYLHFLLGAVAVAGLVVALYGAFRSRDDAAFGGWTIRFGGLWFAVTTAINVLVGFAWLVTLPRETMLRFMGQDPVATATLLLGILFGLAALVFGFLLAQSPRPTPLLRWTVASLLLALVAMVLNRDQVRRGGLEAAGFEPVSWIEPQWGVIAIFAVLLVAALGCVGWMLVALVRSRRSLNPLA